jgi:hypothetical protein
MAITAIGAGLDLADSLVKLISPSITQEENESVLDAAKSRSEKISAAVNDAAMAAVGEPVPELHAICDELCIAALVPSGDLGTNVTVSLDRLQSLLTIANAYVLLVESSQKVKAA